MKKNFHQALLTYLRREHQQMVVYSSFTLRIVLTPTLSFYVHRPVDLIIPVNIRFLLKLDLSDVGLKVCICEWTTSLYRRI